MENTPAGRKATKARIGPWYVLQKRNPAAPGMKFETLLTFVARGRVKVHSIVRGPTTHQLWKFAAQVRGLSREFGVCYSCASPVTKNAAVCPKCNRPQTLPAQPDVFLESGDTEPGHVVYRELPAAAGDPQPANGAAAAPADLAMPATDGASPVAAGHSEEISAPEAGTPEPAVDANRDMIIPSLPDDPPSPAAPRPTTAKERLAQARRQMSAVSASPDSLEEDEDEDEDDDDGFDDGPPRPPRLVGPAFGPGGRQPGAPRKKRTWIEGVMLLIVLLVAVGAGMLYVDPQMQQTFQGWVKLALINAGVHWESKPADTRQEASAEQPGTDGKTAANSIDLPGVAPRIGGPPPVFGPTTPPPVATPLVTATPAAPAQPSASPQPAPAPAPAGSPHAAVEVPAAPTPVTPAPAPSDDTPADATPTPDATDDDPFAKARTLRRRAIDAENSGDYATAVSLFEQIKDLPREAWPGDLELRLRAAKANAEGKPRN